MRIALVSTYLPQQCGIATYTDYLVSQMRRLYPDIDITIVAEREAGVVKEKNFEVHPVWSRREDYVDVIYDEVKDMDIVHIQHEYSIYSFDNRLPRLLEKLEGKVKRVITTHCVRPAQFSERGAVDENYSKKIAERADEVIVHLPSQKDILKRLGIKEDKVHVIPHGTEITSEDPAYSRRRLKLPENGKILLMFGFVKPHKNLHIVLDALKEIQEKRKDVYLFVAGGLAPTAKPKDKEYVDLIYQKIDELELQENVIFPNFFYPNEEVPYIFGASDIVLFPYYEEDRSASGSFHLAIGAGKPVIASRIPKFEELKSISDELLVLPYNASGIANTILRILEDEEFRKYILDKTESYKQETSWENTVKKHVKIYQK